MLPLLHVHQIYLPKLQQNGFKIFHMVAVLHKNTVMASAELDPLQNTAHLLIRSFAEDSHTFLHRPRQELPTASLPSGPTNIGVLAITWGHLPLTEGLPL